MGDLSDFASQLCDSISKNTGRIAAITDRDSFIALAGAPKRELLDKPNSQALDQLLSQRKSYRYTPGGIRFRASEDTDRYYLGVASPILADGDILGCVTILMDESGQGLDDADQKVVQTAAAFLGRQMES